MASVEELPPETGAHSEGFATPIGGGLPSESGDVVAHDLQEQFRGELLQLDEKYPGLGGIFADALPDLPTDEDMLRRTKAELGAAAVKFNPDALLDKRAARSSQSQRSCEGQSGSSGAGSKIKHPGWRIRNAAILAAIGPSR